MKNLHSIVFYALVTPAITLGASSVMAQQSNTDNRDRQQQQQQHQQQQTNPRAQDAKQSDAYNNTDRKNTYGQNRMQNRGHIDKIPANGMHASNLIGTEVRTNDNEDIGKVDDLVIDENGHIVAIIVSVGGFLGMGQKDVAIGWDNVTRTGTSDKQQLRVDVTREDLTTAPKFIVRN
ncbi:PRC-barrel domain-containing protein [Arsukibacterium sp.]|uniref:PRC-barrel domain-containing protein n=1 Tax=Arsukibacterium sp. TaxID=1977258 RepID=UPI002FDA7D7F